jgi:hypothetical protein
LQAHEADGGGEVGADVEAFFEAFDQGGDGELFAVAGDEAWWVLMSSLGWIFAGTRGYEIVLHSPWFARELSPGPVWCKGIGQWCCFIVLVPKRSDSQGLLTIIPSQLGFVCSRAFLNHIPALPLGATYSWPSGADPAATSEANNAKMTDCDRVMIQALLLI